MYIIALALTLALGAPPDLFSIQTDLQGLYDEISQAVLQFATTQDADQFYQVLYTPDWAFVDAAGQRHAWPEMRDQIMHAGPVESTEQPIQKLALVPGGAVTTVKASTTRAIVDTEGRYGKPGESHMLDEKITYRDTWVQVGDQWKLKLREQVGPPRVQVDPSIYY
ncbi:MAG TPA: hypothetical protein VGH34_06970 [Vicinamibacterales bacterium]|jgi:hypothetical protein